MNRILVSAVALLALSGCATKRYGRLVPLSAGERAGYSCREIAIEMSKVDEFNDQITRGSKFNGASAMGFLGDFGIGNANEKNAAERSAIDRRSQLRALAAERGCNSDFGPGPSASQPAMPQAARPIGGAP